MTQVTESAREKFREIMEKEEKSEAYVRIYVSGVG